MASNQIWFTLRFLGKRSAQYATSNLIFLPTLPRRERSSTKRILHMKKLQYPKNCTSFFPPLLIRNGGTILTSRRTLSQEGGRLPRPVDDLRPSGRQSLGRSFGRRSTAESFVFCPRRVTPPPVFLHPSLFPVLSPISSPSLARLSFTHTFLFRVPSLSPCPAQRSVPSTGQCPTLYIGPLHSACTGLGKKALARFDELCYCSR